MRLSELKFVRKEDGLVNFLRNKYDLDDISLQILDYSNEDCVQFDCPICNKNVISFSFYSYFVKDCEYKFVNPYIPSICDDCKFAYNIWCQEPEEFEEELKDVHLKLGIVQPEDKYDWWWLDPICRDCDLKYGSDECTLHPIYCKEIDFGVED